VPATLGQDIVRPEPVTVGRALVATDPRRASPCASLQVRVITSPSAPRAAVDQGPAGSCDGAACAGRARRIELMFRGNRLDLVWMVLPAGDGNAVLRAFTTRHGRPTLAVAFGRIYLAAGAAMREVPAAASPVASPSA